MPRHAVTVEGSPSAWPGYPAAVRGGGFVFASGVRGGQSNGAQASYADVPSDFRKPSQGYTLVDSLEGEATFDAWNAHRNMERILTAAGTRGDQILRQRMWQRDKRLFPVLERVRKGWQPEAAPSSGLGVSSVGGHHGNWFGIECIAADIEDPECLGERIVMTPAEDTANPSASIYSQMVASGPLVFLAGHIPIRTAQPGKPVVASFDDVPSEGRFLATGRSHPDARDGPIAAQTWFVYNEIRCALESHQMAMSDIVHVRAYLADSRDFATFHRVHKHFFDGVAPALSIVGFAEVGHKGCRIEIEPTALQPGALPRAGVEWPCPPPFAGPAAVKTGPLMLLAGILGLGPNGQIAMDWSAIDNDAADFVRSLESSTSVPWVPAQVWWAWRRIEEICRSAGIGLDAIAKTVVYLREETDLIAYDAIRSLFVSDALPAFDCVLVPNPGPVEAAAVQIDVTALIDR